MKNREVELFEGQVVQINPETARNKAFAGCFMVITEPGAYGAQGYIQMVGDNKESPGGVSFYRAEWQEIELLHIDKRATRGGVGVDSDRFAAAPFLFNR